MPGLCVEPIRAKSALNRVNAPSMPFLWSLNPYRSCSHSCPYCYARAYHEWLELDAGADFDTRILVKENLPELLSRELARPSWRGELVAIGTAVDPYQPAEGKYRLTRRALELFAESGTPVSITTKNSMVLRDLDILKELARGPGCVVNVSVTTLDPVLARRIEPGATPPAKRLKAVERLASEGIPAGVMLAPILPWITDSPGRLAQVVAGAARHRAAFLTYGVLRLSGGTKEVFFDFLRREYPHLLKRYAALYARGPSAPPGYRSQVEAVVEGERRRWGLHSPGEERLARAPKSAPKSLPEQLSLFNS